MNGRSHRDREHEVTLLPTPRAMSRSYRAARGVQVAHLMQAQPAIRKLIDAATTVTDRDLDPQQACIIAADARDCEETYTTIVAQIPPIKLGRTTYRVVSGGDTGLEILGPRGGHSSLVRNVHNPELWAHLTMSGARARTTWYRRGADGAFEVLS